MRIVYIVIPLLVDQFSYIYIYISILTQLNYLYCHTDIGIWKFWSKKNTNAVIFDKIEFFCFINIIYITSFFLDLNNSKFAIIAAPLRRRASMTSRDFFNNLNKRSNFLRNNSEDLKMVILIFISSIFLFTIIKIFKI